MNYLFTEAAIAFAAGARVLPEQVAGRSYAARSRRSPALGYADKIDWLLELYPWEIQLAQLNLLDSHDTARLITIAGGDQRQRAPGDAAADDLPRRAVDLLRRRDRPARHELRPRHPPDDRRGIGPRPGICRRWPYHKQLIAMRHAHPALRTGAYHRLYADDDSYAFARTNDDEALLVADQRGRDAAQHSCAVQRPVRRGRRAGGGLRRARGAGRRAGTCGWSWGRAMRWCCTWGSQRETSTPTCDASN